MISIEFIAAINMGISHYRISLYLNFLSRTLSRILSWRKVLSFSLARGHTNYRAVRACDLVDRKTPRVFEKVNLERVEGRCVYTPSSPRAPRASRKQTPIAGELSSEECTRMN